MKKATKATLAVSAAIAAGGLVAANARGEIDKPKPPPEKADAGVSAADPQSQSGVVKLKKAKRPSTENDMELSMPAGTLYDVICRDDLP